MIISDILYLIVGTLVGFLVYKIFDKKLLKSSQKAQKILDEAQRENNKIISQAQKEGENIKKDKILQAKEKFLELKTEHEKNILSKEKKINELQKKIRDKDLMISQELEKTKKHNKRLEIQQNQLEKEINILNNKKNETDKIYKTNIQKFENISGLSIEQAKEELITTLKDEAKMEALSQIQMITEEAKMTAEKEAKKIVIETIQRIGTEEAIDNCVTVFNIKNDEVKGKIIGKEGRNIRALEAATGVDLLVDNTPEAIVLSCFDPVRREIARLSLQKLITDGRMHPARIEEVVKRTSKQINEKIAEIGKQTTISLRINGLHPELVKIVGRMKYRSSYGQNLLQHSREVAKLSAVMASELGLNPKIAKRAGLLHDIGKVAEEEHELSHALLGMQWAKKYGENPQVLNAIGAHHDEIEMTSFISPIVQVCDAISGARPGVRRQFVDSYIQRLKDLENLALGFDGVDKAYAIQAGRELRVFVESKRVNDKKTSEISYNISNKIQTEMSYPGQVKVTVIRETRAVSIAK